MKKLLFFIYALVVAFIFTSCEGLDILGGSNIKITSPYTDIVVSNFVCEGYTYNGDVYIDFDVVSTEGDLSVYFGSAYANVGGEEYKAPAVGTINLKKGSKEKITYWGDLNFSNEYSCFENIPTQLTGFDYIEVAIIVDGIEDVKYIKIENVKIDWKDQF